MLSSDGVQNKSPAEAELLTIVRANVENAIVKINDFIWTFYIDELLRDRPV